MPTIKEKLDSLNKAMQEEVPGPDGRYGDLYTALWSTYRKVERTTEGRLLDKAHFEKRKAESALIIAELELSAAQRKVDDAKSELEQADLLYNTVGAIQLP